MNQSKTVASLTTTRLSPLAKPFTLNRSTHQPNSLLSTQETSVYSLDHCNGDPFSSLLDSFRKSNLGSKSNTVVSVPLGDYGFGQDTVKTTLPVDTGTQTPEKSLFEQYPSLEFQKKGDLDGLNGSRFDIVEEFSVPTYSPSVTGLGYGIGNGNEVSYGKQGVDFHESLFGKENEVGSSVADGSMLQKGKHTVDGLNPHVAVSDNIFKKGSGTIGGKDFFSNSKGTIHPADECSSFLSKISPLKLSMTDKSAAEDNPQNQSSKNSGDSDSDVDSPCWKGTMASSLTPSGTLGSVQFHHVGKVTEKHNSLNPLAPQFFPGIGYVRDDFVSSNSSAPVATNLLPGEDILMKTVMAESSVELNKGIELEHSSNISGGEKAFNTLNDKTLSSVYPVINSHYMMPQSSSKDDCSTSKGKLAAIADVDDFVKGTKDPRASGSISGVFPAKAHSSTATSTISSSRVDVVTDLFKTLEGVLKSLIESPKPDVQVIVSAMHALSELLVQTFVDSVDSYNEHDHDMIQQIINNLNVFSTKICGQKIPNLDSALADSPYCHDRSLELPKGLEVTSIKSLTVPYQLYLQNDYTGKTSVSTVFAQSGQNSFPSSSGEVTEKGNEIAQVIRRSLGKSLDFENQMQPEALLYRNLWLDSEAERCCMKLKTYLCLMEAGRNRGGDNAL